MNRQLLSASAIQKAVTKTVNTDDEIIEAGVEVLVGPPTWRQPDHNGCNWVVEYTPRYEGYMNKIFAAIADAQLKFNLA